MREQRGFSRDEHHVQIEPIGALAVPIDETVRLASAQVEADDPSLRRVRLSEHLHGESGDDEFNFGHMAKVGVRHLGRD